MRSEGVAQGVRMHVGGEAAQNGHAFDDAAHVAGGQAGLAAELAETGFTQAAQLHKAQLLRHLLNADAPCSSRKCSRFLLEPCQKHGRDASGITAESKVDPSVEPFDRSDRFPQCYPSGLAVDSL